MFLKMIIIFLFLCLCGACFGAVGLGSSDSLDYGDCYQLPSTLMQRCTYKDGHHEILNLSDMTGR